MTLRKKGSVKPHQKMELKEERWFELSAKMEG
jgi:hypothetical protein